MLPHRTDFYFGKKLFRKKNDPLSEQEPVFALLIRYCNTKKLREYYAFAEPHVFRFFNFLLVRIRCGWKNLRMIRPGRRIFALKTKKCAYRSKRTKNANSDSRQTNPVQKNSINSKKLVSDEILPAFKTTVGRICIFINAKVALKQHLTPKTPLIKKESIPVFCILS